MPGHTLPTGLLRAGALAGAAAAFLLLAPDQARAADPLADTADLVAEVTAPVVEGATPVVEALEPATGPVVEATQPVTDPIVEATQPVTDPIVEATQPVTDPIVETTKPIVETTKPIVETTKPIVDEMIGRVDPIVDLPPIRRVLAPSTPSSPAEEVTVRRAPLTDKEREVPPLSVTAAAAAPTQLTPPSSADDTAAILRFTAPGRQAVTALVHEPSGPGSPFTNAGGGLLIGMLAATLVGVAAGRQSLLFERLRLPSGLALAPPVPPG